MGAPKEILDLVDRFREQYDSYRSPSYNEAQLRQEFANPFFKALGWDLDNEQGYAEAYKEVIHEDSIKVGGSTKAPDYSFRIGGVRKFFVETKKPAVDIREDASPAYQLRRYAWSAKLPLSILTDFEEFAVYDCRVRPDKNDKASTARTLYLKYDEYDERWDELASIFSRQAILKGSFDKYAESTKKKRGTAEVDDVFLKDIEAWRGELARNLALRNPELSQRELNFAVQKTIDRIIFLRICEDRGIERYGSLQALLGGPRIYPRLCELFHQADDRYNSGLFHFTKEKDRNEEPDQWTLSLAIDDGVLKDVIRRLYYPESPYEFSVLGADILGQVYEQFLGKVIRLTKGHQAKVEDKPEVKKAGGVYYTPTYIVDYIVQQTVGKLLEGKTPHEVAARTTTTWKRSKRGRPLSVLDPACGSGSFLIGAYRYLLDWYLKWYTENEPHKWLTGSEPKIYESGARSARIHAGSSEPDESGHYKRSHYERSYRLTTAERKRILLDHVFGVDIDPQAVEVTKLSLLLKVLEGENQESLQRQLRLFRERALPDLAENIKCGNSLIGPDFYQGKQLDLFGEEERLRINVFDWQAEFREIMQSGGFDAVIGNPPYVRQEGVSRYKSYLKRQYGAYHGLADLYVYFVERGLALVRPEGLLAYICSGKFTQAGYGVGLRRVLRKHEIVSILDYGDAQVFRGATTYPIVAIIRREQRKTSRQFAYAKATMETGVYPADILPAGFEVNQALLTEAAWVFVSAVGASVLKKLESGVLPLRDAVGPAQLGIKTSLNAAFVISAQRASELLEEDRTAAEIIKPYTRGRNTTKWLCSGNGSFLVCARESIDIAEYPSVLGHLRGFEKDLRARYEVRRGDYDWWVIRQVANTDIFDNPKLVYPDLCSSAKFALNLDGSYPNNTVFCLPTDNLALLSFLNSRLSWYWITLMCPANRGGAYRLFNQYINQLPVREDVLQNSELSAFGRRMLTIHEQLVRTKTTHERTALQRQIEATDREIDRLVYDLYGLTDEEIRIVEEATAR
jgi:predicted type IV restriction endonuclease